MSNANPGWYPDGNDGSKLRYWDGQNWTEHTAPAQPQAPIAPTGNPMVPPPAQQKNWFSRHKALSAVLAVVLIVIVGGAIGSGGSDDPENASDASSPKATDEPSDTKAVDESEPEPEPTPESTSEPEPEPEPEPELTVSQENAIRSAESYLDYTAFSRQGLIDQLVFEDYSTKDATFAVDSLSVNYDEQAVKAAKAYLDYTSFSRQGLIDQLVFEGYSVKQATYGVNKTGL